MARVNPEHVMADMVDCSVFSRLATRFNVMGVPMTLVNSRTRITGAVPEGTLVKTIQEAFA